MSGYKVTVNYPNMPKGQELSIPGLGTFQNGSEAEVTKEQADAFRAYQTDVSMPDKTLLEAFKGNKFVTVEALKKEDPDPKKAPKTDEPPQDAITTGDQTEKGSDK